MGRSELLRLRVSLFSRQVSTGAPLLYSVGDCRPYRSRPMTSALRKADQDLLHKLLLGQLSSAEAERLALEYADDSRLAELAESLACKDDTLLELLRHHGTVVD